MATIPLLLLPTLFTLLFLGDSIYRHVAGESYSVCNGSIAECHPELETMMASESSRRIMEQKKYITPGALKRDQPVCRGGGGEAYSKSEGCLPPPSNPEHRGCSKYYRCRSDH